MSCVVVSLGYFDNCRQKPRRYTLRHTITGLYASYGHIRVPVAGRASNPGPCVYPIQQEVYGPHIDYDVNWMPNNINLTDILDQNGHQRTPKLKRIQNINQTATEQLPAGQSPYRNPQSLLLNELMQEDNKKPKVAEERRESLMEWFDRSVEKELRKHKETSLGRVGFSPTTTSPPEELKLSRGALERMAEASASQIEIVSDMRREPDAELSEAVDKLAKAEAMSKFAGAVRAAEAAAKSVPPELAEEAAVASARGFQTEVQTTNIHHDFDGDRPMEVVGYIGITKPKYATRRQ
ncbi:uncharacterized protein LOC132705102 [Cylas formicarius]|uniref:uncharacterized protein LOC132705102 n=1 Tax=Cylas formicarius TaxID=197179 RepID=UPI0029586D91|nr:uncharacterized protein LOC132705102 [Cylas formicarius]